MGYRFEPHDHICSAVHCPRPCTQLCTTRRCSRGVPGVVYRGGCLGGCIPGTQPPVILRSRVQIQGPDPGPDHPQTGPDWSQDRPLRISNLRYTGFKGFLLPSIDLSLRRPRIGYARLLSLSYSPNHSTIPDLRQRYIPRSYYQTATNVPLK